MKKQTFSWRKYVPNKAQLGAQGPMILLGVLGVGLLLAVILSLVPALKTLDQELATLSDAEQQVTDAQAAQVAEQQIIRKQIELARSGTLSKTRVLLTKAQASSTLDQLYQLASSTNVRIVTLQNQPTPETDKTTTIDTTRFRLNVAGELLDLLNFIALTKQTIPSQAFLFSNVSVSEESQNGVLLMDLVLFTSSSLTTQALSDSVAATQPMTATQSITVTAPVSVPEATPVLTPTVDASSYLVKPDNWPSEWAWPPSTTPTVQPTPTQQYKTYIVQPGDSLSTIASQFNTTVQDLVTANKLGDYTIYVNQKLLVPTS